MIAIDLMDAEVRDNAKIARLVAQGVISVQAISSEASLEPVSRTPERSQQS